MSRVIATIRLAMGRVAYYDELTRIHLTIDNPIQEIYEGMNLTNIRKGVKNKSLTLLSGSLDVKNEDNKNNFIPVDNIKSAINKEEKKVKKVKENKETKLEEEKSKEVIIEEEKISEPIVEEKVEEIKSKESETNIETESDTNTSEDGEDKKEEKKTTKRRKKKEE